MALLSSSWCTVVRYFADDMSISCRTILLLRLINIMLIFLMKFEGIVLYTRRAIRMNIFISIFSVAFIGCLPLLVHYPKLLNDAPLRMLGGLILFLRRGDFSPVLHLIFPPRNVYIFTCASVQNRVKYKLPYQKQIPCSMYLQ